MQLICKKDHAETRMCDKFFSHTKLQVVAGGCIWVAGLLIAGSDSPYMPWLNGIGAVVFSGASLVLGKLLPLVNPDETGVYSHDRLSCFMTDVNRDQIKNTQAHTLPCNMVPQARIISNF